jgi:hypothetical protein
VNEAARAFAAISEINRLASMRIAYGELCFGCEANIQNPAKYNNFPLSFIFSTIWLPESGSLSRSNGNYKVGLSTRLKNSDFNAMACD